MGQSFTKFQEESLQGWSLLRQCVTLISTFPLIEDFYFLFFLTFFFLGNTALEIA